MRCRSSPGPGRYRARAGCDRPPEGERVNLPGGAAPAVVLRGLVKRFGATLAVAGLDLDIPAGSFSGVVGPNGAGKTTTLSMATASVAPNRLTSPRSTTAGATPPGRFTRSPYGGRSHPARVRYRPGPGEIRHRIGHDQETGPMRSRSSP